MNRFVKVVKTREKRLETRAYCCLFDCLFVIFYCKHPKLGSAESHTWAQSL